MKIETIYRKTNYRTIVKHRACLFCNSREMGPRTILDMIYWFVILDSSSVNESHVLIILKRHHPDIFNLRPAEWTELEEMIERAKEYIDHKCHPDGYNLGINCGEAGFLIGGFAQKKFELCPTSTAVQTIDSAEPGEKRRIVCVLTFKYDSAIL